MTTQLDLSIDNPKQLLTLQQKKRKQKASLDRILDTAGSMSHLSKMIDVPYTTIQGWISRGQISAKGAKVITSHPKLGKAFTNAEILGEV